MDKEFEKFMDEIISQQRDEISDDELNDMLREQRIQHPEIKELKE